MSAPRKQVPRTIRDQVMGEFNHLCAICGQPNPQLHHIDENHDNNEPSNLLPLCPNHHLSDQHSPTRRIGVGIVQLFRRYKDPAILSAQFEPLYDRARYMVDLEAQLPSTPDEASRELVAFIAVLEMGEFYSQRIEKLTSAVSSPWAITGSTTDADIRKHSEDDRARTLAKLRRNQAEVVDLIVELLRYQSWKPASGI
jgi:hypothetical protein